VYSHCQRLAQGCDGHVELSLTSATPGIVSPLYSETYSEIYVGCERRASYILCRTCFDALPRVGSPLCVRCGLPTAFATLVCEECKNVDFDFESAGVSLRALGDGCSRVILLAKSLS
jgi:hypothetical protein